MQWLIKMKVKRCYSQKTQHGISIPAQLGSVLARWTMLPLVLIVICPITTKQNIHCILVWCLLLLHISPIKFSKHEFMLWTLYIGKRRVCGHTYEGVLCRTRTCYLVLLATSRFVQTFKRCTEAKIFKPNYQQGRCSDHDIVTMPFLGKTKTDRWLHMPYFIKYVRCSQN